MNKFLWILVAMSGQIVLGVGSQGTHLIPLRESREVDFGHSTAVHFKSDEKQRYSIQVAKDRLKRLHASEEYQVVAAWLQTKWLQKNTGIWGRTEMTKSRFFCWDRVEKLIEVLAQVSPPETSIFEIYEQCYTKTAFKDRSVPGCGNRPTVLMRPDKFLTMMSLHAPTLKS
jgi:hypothetical protein